MSAGGTVNKVWEKFGCNDYDVAIFAFSDNQTAAQLISGYTSNGATPKFPIVDKDHSGPQIKTIFNTLFPDGYGYGRTAFIRKDKSFIRIYYTPEATFTTALTTEGCQLHTCDNTDILENIENAKIGKCALRLVCPKECVVTVQRAGDYTIDIFSATGRRIASECRQLTIGTNRIVFQNDRGLNQGVIIISVKDSNTSFVFKQVVR